MDVSRGVWDWVGVGGMSGGGALGNHEGCPYGVARVGAFLRGRGF